MSASSRQAASSAAAAAAAVTTTTAGTAAETRPEYASESAAGWRASSLHARPQQRDLAARHGAHLASRLSALEHVMLASLHPTAAAAAAPLARGDADIEAGVGAPQLLPSRGAGATRRLQLPRRGARYWHPECEDASLPHLAAFGVVNRGGASDGRRARSASATARRREWRARRLGAATTSASDDSHEDVGGGDSEDEDDGDDGGGGGGGGDDDYGSSGEIDDDDEYDDDNDGGGGGGDTVLGNQAPPLRFPTHWSYEDKSSGVALRAGDRPCIVVYCGAGKFDVDAAAVRANCPVPPQVCVYYYEITILSAGAEGFIGFGLAAKGVPVDRLPGWERNSIGWHGDDGHIFKDSGVGTPYGPTFTTGDVVGCCWNRLTGEVFFTKNGKRLKRAFSGMHMRMRLHLVPQRAFFGNHSGDVAVMDAMYPTVGLRTDGEMVEANFGAQPFAFDVAAYVREEVERRRDAVLRASRYAPPARTMRHMVMDYLITEGYADAARAMQRQVVGDAQQRGEAADGRARGVDARDDETGIELRLADADKRCRVLRCVSAGAPDEAERLCRELFPGALDAGAPLSAASSSSLSLSLQQQRQRSDAYCALVMLRCARFVELLRRYHDACRQRGEGDECDAGPVAALRFARASLWPLVCGDDADEVREDDDDDVEMAVEAAKVSNGRGRDENGAVDASRSRRSRPSAAYCVAPSAYHSPVDDGGDGGGGGGARRRGVRSRARHTNRGTCRRAVSTVARLYVQEHVALLAYNSVRESECESRRGAMAAQHRMLMDKRRRSLVVTALNRAMQACETRARVHGSEDEGGGIGSGGGGDKADAVRVALRGSGGGEVDAAGFASRSRSSSSTTTPIPPTPTSLLERAVQHLHVAMRTCARAGNGWVALMKRGDVLP